MESAGPGGGIGRRGGLKIRFRQRSVGSSPTRGTIDWRACGDVARDAFARGALPSIPGVTWNGQGARLVSPVHADMVGLDSHLQRRRFAPTIIRVCYEKRGREAPTYTAPKAAVWSREEFPTTGGVRLLGWHMAAGDFYCRGAQAKEGVKDSQERGSSHQRRDQRAYLPPDRRRWFPAWSVRHSRRPTHRGRAEPRPRGDRSQCGASRLQGHGLSQVQV